MDGDGKLDVATANYAGQSVSLLRNQSVPGEITSTSLIYRGDIAITTGTHVGDVRIGDLNGDGLADLVVAAASGSAHRFRVRWQRPGAVFSRGSRG